MAKGEPYKRKLPSGNISWIADYTDPFTGKRRRESFAKKKLAVAKLEEVVYRKIKGVPVDNTAQKTTLGKMIDDYKAKCLQTEEEASFNRNRRFTLQRFESEFGRPTLVASIQYRHIEDYRDKLIHTPTAKKAKRAGASVNREITQIRRMFRKSKKRGFLLRNPFRNDDGELRLPEAKRDRYWTKDEFEALLAECADHLRSIVFTAVATGIRRGNLLALTWDMVEFDRDCIALPEGMTKNKQALDVPISYSLRHVLKAIRKAQLEQHLATGRKSKPPKHVFTYSKKLHGRIVASPVKDIKTAFQAARRRSKLDDVRFHDSRHTCATHLRDAGVDIHMIGTILGHSWTNMTQRYAHESWEPKKEAISHIEQLIAESAGTYWHTPQNESNEPTEQRVINAL